MYILNAIHGSGGVGKTGRDRHGFKDIFLALVQRTDQKKARKKARSWEATDKEMNCLMTMWEKKLKSKEYKPSVNLTLNVSFSITIRKKQYHSH